MMLVVLEGIDGAGKGELSRWIARTWNLPRYEFPAGLFPALEDALQKKRALKPSTMGLLFLAEMEELSPTHGVLERYYYSTWAYQGLLWDERKVEDIIMALDLPKPDVVILLDVEPEIGLSRNGKKGRKLYEKLEFLSQVRHRYLMRAEKEGWPIVDANRPLEDVKSKVEAILSHYIHTGDPQL